MEYFIILVFGILLGYNFRKQPTQVKEDDKDFTYYKNLSSSLMNDVRCLRQENRELRGISRTSD